MLSIAMERTNERTNEPSFLDSPSFLESFLSSFGFELREGENGPNSVHSYRRNFSCSTSRSRSLYLLGRCIVERIGSASEARFEKDM